MLTGFKWVVGVVVFFAAVGVVVTLVSGGTSWLTAPLRGAVDAREQTVADGDYRNATYNHFYNLCTSVQAAEDAIENLEAEKDSGVSEDREARIDQSITAQRNARLESLREYNAATQQETKEFMKDSSLPESLDVADHDTEC